VQASATSASETTVEALTTARGIEAAMQVISFVKIELE
jgi:hypothetical protein